MAPSHPAVAGLAAAVGGMTGWVSPRVVRPRTTLGGATTTTRARRGETVHVGVRRRRLNPGGGTGGGVVGGDRNAWGGFTGCADGGGTVETGRSSWWVSPTTLGKAIVVSHRALGKADGAGPDAGGTNNPAANFGNAGLAGGVAAGVGPEGTGTGVAPTPTPMPMPTKNGASGGGGGKRARLKQASRRVWKAWRLATTGVGTEEVDVVNDKGEPLPVYPVDPPQPDAGVLNNQAADLASTAFNAAAAAAGAGGGGGVGVGLMATSNNVDGGVFRKSKKRNYHLAVNPPKPHTVMRINAGNAAVNPGETTRQALSRRALLRDAELTPRDLRRIDPSLLQTNNTPALLVSDQTILINLGVRVIIRPDHALLFEPDTATAKRFLEAVKTRDRVNSKAASSEKGEACPADRSLSHFEVWDIVEVAREDTTTLIDDASGKVFHKRPPPPFT